MGAIKSEISLDESATSCNSLGITRTFRDLRPAHCLFKVVSYSLLEDEYYVSDVFQAGDYKWRLRFYPNGDTKKNGNGYVSLYLTMADPNTLPCGFEVNVSFKLFVYDQMHDKYMIIQESGEGAIRRFNENIIGWGFPQLVHLDIFKDVSNGFLIDDFCIFGAEVFVLNSSDFKSLRLVPKPKEALQDTYVWKLEKISTLKNKLYISEVFALLGREWKVHIYLKGIHSGKGESVETYLVLDDVPKKYKVRAEFSISLQDQIHNNHHKQTVTYVFSKSPYKCGFNIITMEQLHLPSNGLVKNDTLIIKVKLAKISLVIE